MIGRLHAAFQSQKEFTSSASHEIRTPITRMSFALENLVSLEKHSPQTLASLVQMQEDVSQLKDLTDSLLLLTKFDKSKIQTIFEEIRIDEVIFEAYEKVEKSFPQLKMDFSISDDTSEDAQLVVNGVKSLLEIVFINLFKNAAKYSFAPEMNVEIKETSTELTVNVSSQGNVIPSEEIPKLFHAFARGSNAQNISGSGLGLRISQRILEHHDGEIHYATPAENMNVFSVVFPKN
jgi:K+-sensing histidine kinase KdpD